MGKRSRKRTGSERAVAGPRSAGGTSREERDAARRARAEAMKRGKAPSRSRRGGELPEAPWGGFPLSELMIFIGIVLAVVGFFVQGERGIAMVLVGAGFVCIASVEVSAREHLAGYRSHTTVIASLPAVTTAAALYFARVPWPVVVIGAALVLTGVFWWMRRVFVLRARRARG